MVDNANANAYWMNSILGTCPQQRDIFSVVKEGALRLPALCSNPKFMLLDEPFAGVDPISVTDIQNIIRHLAARGIGVLITDHNVRETPGICNRGYIVNVGRVIAEGPPAALLTNTDVRQVYLANNLK